MEHLNRILVLLLFVVFWQTSLANGLVISEIYYNEPTSGSDTLEFIELYNNSDSTINMGDYRVEDAVECAFPEVDLNPREYLVLCTDSLIFENYFGIEAIEWKGALNNTGEPILVKDSSGQIVDSVHYTDNADWPDADGTGPSLILCDYDSENQLSENWKASITPADTLNDGSKVFASPGKRDHLCRCNEVGGQPTFQKIYDSAKKGKQDVKRMIVQRDSSYYIGMNRYLKDSLSDIQLLKIGREGKLRWKRTFDFANEELLKDMIATHDSNMLGVGHISKGIEAGDSALWMVKLNPSGDTLWSQQYSDTLSHLGSSVIQTPDSNFVLTGQGVNNTGLSVMKMAQKGQKLWLKRYRENDEDVVHMPEGHLENLSDSVYGAYGRIKDTVNHTSYAFVMTFDEYGDTIWWNRTPKTAGADTMIYLNALHALSDSGYIASGYARIRVDTAPEVYRSFGYLKRIGQEGQTRWNSFSDRQAQMRFYDVVSADKNSVTTIARKWKDQVLSSNMMLVKFDMEGNIIRTELLPRSRGYEPSDMKVTQDESYLIGGNKIKDAETFQPFMLKTNAYGFVEPNSGLPNTVNVCDTDTHSLSANKGFSSYQWNTDSVNPSLQVTGNGAYRLTVTDMKGCVATDTVQVAFHDPSKPAVNGPSHVTAEQSYIFSTHHTEGAVYEWHTNSGNIVAGQTTDSVSIEWSSMGSDSLWIRKIDTLGCEAVSDSFVVDIGATPVAESSLLSFTIAPNPFSDYIRITFSQSGDYHIAIWDMKGQCRYERQINNREVQMLDLSFLDAGKYIIKVVSETESQSAGLEKIIKTE